MISPATMDHSILEWTAFLGFVLAMLALDLGVFHRKDHVVGPREALGWSVLWVSLALCFGGYIWVRFGSETGMQYLTGYVIEKSLSVDSIFAFVLLFVGGKMALIDLVKIHAAASLAVVVSILAIGIVASAIRNKRSAARAAANRSPGA